MPTTDLDVIAAPGAPQTFSPKAPSGGGVPFRPDQDTWIQYAGNPIITLAPSSWYTSQLYDNNIMVDPTDPTKLLMFLSGMASPTQLGEESIGRTTATIADPYTWSAPQQVLTGTLFWEGAGPGGAGPRIRLGSVIHNPDDGKLYMFYTGMHYNASASYCGLATSTDNGFTWTKIGYDGSVNGLPILVADGFGRNDGNFVSEPAVVKIGNEWTMIYSYRNEPAGIILPGFRYATSPNGYAWTKGGTGDIFTIGDGTYTEFKQIIQINGRWYLIYDHGNLSTNWKSEVTSSDNLLGPYNGPRTVVVEKGPSGSWNEFHVACSFIVEVGGRWKLYFQGCGDHFQPYGTNTWPIGITESSWEPGEGPNPDPRGSDPFTNLSVTGTPDGLYTISAKSPATGDIVSTERVYISSSRRRRR